MRFHGCYVAPIRAMCLTFARTFPALVVAATTSPYMVAAESKHDPSQDEAAIRATADAFVKAFDRGDAKAVAALWTDTGSLVDDEGRAYKGRKAIEEAYSAFFKTYPGVRMKIAVQSVELPTATTAIEDGVATVMTDNDSSASRYTAVHVLQDGKWLMATVRESRIDVPSNSGRLQPLAWLVGKWEAKADDTVVGNDIRWIANKSFLIRDYVVKEGGNVTASGTQIIGWDPQSGQIKSWSFDSSGGHGTGMWTPMPEGWHVASTGVMPDGTPTASQDLLIRVAGEENVLGWRSIGRRIGATQLPDMPEVVLERKAKP